MWRRQPGGIASSHHRLRVGYARALSSVVAVLGLAGCAVYDAAQYHALSECDKLPSMADRQRCRESKAMSQQQYEAERAKLKKAE